MKSYQKIRIEIPRAVKAKFRRKAREAFPKETYAYLFGRRAGGLYIVEDLWVPPDVEKHCTKSFVFIQEHWEVAAYEEAKEEGLEVIGDIHSHPQAFKIWNGSEAENVPSIGDHREGWSGICGICLVSEKHDGKLRTKVDFYSPCLPAEVVEV